MIKISRYILLFILFFSSQLICLAQTSITTSTTIDQAWINNHSSSLPFLLGAGVTITLSENLIFNAVNMYFSIQGANVTIDGNGKTITISNITNFLGLVNNGQSSVAGFQNSIVKNLGVVSNNSSLISYAGWIGQPGYGVGGVTFSISNCYSTGDMKNIYTGGILGNCSMTGTISNCYSLGNLSVINSAGIALYFCSKSKI